TNTSGNWRSIEYIQTKRTNDRPPSSRLDAGNESLELAGQLLKQPPHGRFPLRVVSLQFFILGPPDGGNRLILGCAARNLFLNGVAHIHKHLPEAAEPLSGFSRVWRNRSVSRHENVGSERFDRIQRAQPVEAV